MTEEKKTTEEAALPNAASQGMGEYIKARFLGLPPLVIKAVGVDEPGSGAGGYIELLLREEYWRLRCVALENNLTEFVRAYMAAFKVIEELKPDDTEDQVKAAIRKALEEVPDNIDKTPEI